MSKKIGPLVFTGGVTRQVVLVGRWAIKFPQLRNGWTNFLHGILANLRERSTWQALYSCRNSDFPHAQHYSLLCPVLWGWAGFINVMPRCKPITEYEWYQAGQLEQWHRADLGGDDKHLNYGRYRGRIVKLDYGHLDYNKQT